MIAKVWRWFFRLTLCIGLLCGLLFIRFMVDMSTATVRQSDGWLQLGASSTTETLSGSFPASATRFRFVRSSVGIGGRFLAYAVDGESSDLEQFALKELAAHAPEREVSVANDQPSPFDAESIQFLERAYSVQLDWLRETENHQGSILRDSGSSSSQIPIIFIDKENGLLYLVFTD